MRIIASANQKGGCGKTTTAINLSSSLAFKGQRVLLIDCDPQAHATMGLDVKPYDLAMSIYDVLKPGANAAGIEDILIPVREHFDLAPSSGSLSAVEQELAGVDGREGRLLEAIGSLRRGYDYVIIDCPPSIGHLCFNALRACDEVIIPIDLSLFSLRGVSKLLEIVLLLKEKVGHDIKSRALVTMFDNRTKYSRYVLGKVKEEFGENVYETVIRYNIRLRETVDHGMPIGDYDKHSIGHMDYEGLAEEVLRSQASDQDATVDSVDAVQGMLQRTEEYVENVENEVIVEDSEPTEEESPSQVVQPLHLGGPTTIENLAEESLFVVEDEGETT